MFMQHNLDSAKRLNEAVIENLANGIVKAFAGSGYPAIPFEIVSAPLTLQIRMPPALHPKVLGINKSFKELATMFPCIEEINIRPEFQNLGLFTKTVLKLSKEPSVQAVVVGHVMNSEFSKSLANKCAILNSGWSHFPGSGLPSYCFSSKGFVPTNPD
jgi:hypothetical protein